MSKGAMVAIVGSVAAAVSAFLNWYSFETLGISTSFNVWDYGTGKAILVLALIGLFLAATAGKSKGKYTGAIVAGALALVVVFANYPSGEEYAGVSIEAGYWLSLVGGIMMVAGGVMGRKDAK